MRSYQTLQTESIDPARYLGDYCAACSRWWSWEDLPGFGDGLHFCEVCIRDAIVTAAESEARV